ncbi:quinol monooxygenase YgiN [Natranaerovirga hydrolytica]|uniref:Quinol monooxygenase YgiN n=1 Tax=Natranaerovirga hydrolytica TaxID=680378 RepID=A0A4R1M9Q3_9FIRM|nr:putative quinol monooxygenase [Natranaerovirga hydrolytica]TCK89086.1 quinol monooxygenase YgiN [Natranaerovirga hydrolytica]
MIRIIVKQFVKPDLIDRYIEIMKEMVAKTRELDEGCIEYGLFQDSKDPQIITLIEGWESQHALDKHMDSTHFKEIIPPLSTFFEKPEEVNIYRPVGEKRK